MKELQLVSLFLIVATTFLAVMAALKLGEAKRIVRDLKALELKPKPNVIHEPEGGPPAGFVRAGVVFTSKEGGQVYGCVNMEDILRRGVLVDSLAPGEKVDVHIAVSAPSEERRMIQ